jgi:hypothetical protein
MDQVENTNANKMGVFERIIKVFYAPSKVMEAIKSEPKILIPWLGLLIFSMLLSFMNMEAVKESLVQSFMATQAQTGLEITEGYIQTMAIVSAITGSLFLSAIPFITGLLAHVVGLIVGGKGSVKKSLSVVMTSMYITLVGSLLTMLVSMGLNTQLTFSLGYAIPGITNLSLKTILMSVEVFTIWALIVNTIGMKKVHEVSTVKAFLMVFIPQVLYIALSLIGIGAAQSMM